LRAKLKDLEKIRVGAVSYLNTRPLLYGLKHHPVSQRIDLVEDYPARIAQLLADGAIDLGLIPVAATLRLKEWHIASRFCIGARGPVASVCLFSEVPMEEVRSVYLDYQSRTSVNLARILLKEYWKKDVELIDATGEDYRQKISGTTAGVVIGDRALEQRLTSHYSYDLAEAWLQHTGLPFVFAAWISRRKLPEDFINAFDAANELGLQRLEEVIRSIPFPAYSLDTYFRQNIQYRLSEEAGEGMQLFLEKLKAEARVAG
jgi:chorismate dehydratase